MADNSKKKKIIVIAVAFLLVIAGIVAFLLYRNSIKATTMRILRLEGSVSLQEDGALKSVKENLRLVSGNVLDTSDESLVSIGLDEVKIVTLDELSRAEFNQNGKYLNLDLTKGSLFFEVDKPLAEDETFEIETSTMIVGIRGTSGWVSVDGENESLIITDGHVHVIGTNPVTGEVKEVDVNAGQRLIVYLYNDREVDSIMFELEDVTEHELSKFVINILRNKASLLDKVIAATGWDRDYILGISDADPEPDPDDDPNTTQVADADPEPDPEPEPEPDPVIPDVGGNDDPNPAQDNNGNNNPGNNNNTNNNNNNNNNGNNTGVTTADTLVTAPVTRTELEKQIDAAKAQIVSINANGTYTLADNTVFDPAYYGQAYPDVVAQYGNTSEALLAHYVATGQGEGRYASQAEQDAAKLAEDIARLEAQRVADEANSANNNQNTNNTNNNQLAQNQQQQQQQQQQQATPSANQVSNGAVTFTSGSQATYDDATGMVTITSGNTTGSATTATIPQQIEVSPNTYQQLTIGNVAIDPNSGVNTVDVSSTNSTPNQIGTWLSTQNNAGNSYTVVDSPMEYSVGLSLNPGTNNPVIADVDTNVSNNLATAQNILTDAMIKGEIDLVSIGTVGITYSGGTYTITDGPQVNHSNLTFDTANSNASQLVFTTGGNLPNQTTYTISSDGTITTT